MIVSKVSHLSNETPWYYAEEEEDDVKAGDQTLEAEPDEQAAFRIFFSESHVDEHYCDTT